ncbi:MAG: hypothetical protein ACHQAX_07870 [Gammaproteobacteria bacterium]
MVTLTSIPEFLQLIQSDHCPEHLTLVYRYGSLGDLEPFAEALRLGRSSKHLTLDLRYTSISDGGANALAAALQSGQCKEHLTFYLWGNNIAIAGAKAFASALQSGRCPEHLNLSLFSNNDIGDEGAKAFATAIQSGLCPDHLSLSLSYTNIGVEGAKAIACAIKSGRCPDHFDLSLSNNDIGDEGVEALADALQSGRCPAHLSLSISGENIGVRGAKALASAIQSGRCPEYLRLDLQYHHFSIEGAEAFANALLKTPIPKGLDLCFDVDNKATIQKILIKKVEETVVNSSASIEDITEAINAARAVNSVWRYKKQWGINPEALLYPMLFQKKLDQIRLKPTSPIRDELDALLTEFYNKAYECGFQKSTRWAVFFERIADHYSQLPSSEFDAITMLDLKRIRHAITMPDCDRIHYNTHIIADWDRSTKIPINFSRFSTNFTKRNNETFSRNHIAQQTKTESRAFRLWSKIDATDDCLSEVRKQKTMPREI